MRFMLRALAVLVVVAAARADGPVNPDFEGDAQGAAPAAWFVPGPSAGAGWSAVVRKNVAGRDGQCVSVALRTAGGAGAQANAGTGNLMQQFDAAPFRGKRVVLSAWMRVRADNPQAGGQGQMWMRVDREGGKQGFFDNSSDRPARNAKWEQFKIIADVDVDAVGVAIGFLATGATVWVDDVGFEVVGDAKSAAEPPRELTDRGLTNLVAFTRLAGFVRYYHPSDESAACNWEEFVRANITRIEAAADGPALAAELAAVFEPVAPAMVVQHGPFAAQFAARSMLAEGDTPTEATAWFRYGFTHTSSHGIYQAERRTWPHGGEAPEHVAKLGEHTTAEVAPGVWVRMPLAVYRDAEGTLPRARTSIMPVDDADYVRPSGDDRPSRLAAVIIAWNVFQHHYPYFDVVGVDWGEALAVALREAAAAANGAAFHETLERLVAKLEDGHGYVGYTGAGRWARVPLAWALVGEQLVVTEVGAGVAEIREGDEVVKINGRPVAELASAAAARVSAATPQHRRFRTAGELARGELGESCQLLLRRPDGTEYTQTVAYAQQSPIEPRPEKIGEIRPGIWYVDIDRVNDADVNGAMDKLAAAEGLVFDLRGYPGRLGTVVLAHLTDVPLRSARWCIPLLPRPDREGVSFTDGGWPVPPMPPRWTKNAAFIIDGRAISYAETYMGIVEHFKLAAIVGEATAGTNGNVTSFNLPGGYSVGFTGMRVLKHDGSTHHGVGILPTIPVSRTIEGIAAGKDELLNAAVAHVEKNRAAK